MIKRLLSLFTPRATTNSAASPEPQIELVYVGPNHPLYSQVGWGYADPRWLATVPAERRRSVSWF